MSDMVDLEIELDEELWDEVVRVAADLGVDPNTFIAVSLTDYVQKAKQALESGEDKIEDPLSDG